MPKLGIPLAQRVPQVERLRKLGLPDGLVERAESIRWTLGEESAAHYLEFFERLLQTDPLHPLPPLGQLHCLTALDDEGRALVSTLVKGRIPSVGTADDLETLNAVLFLIGDLPHDDAAVHTFVHTGMRRTLDARTGTFQSRAKHFNYHDARDALLGCKQIFDDAGKRFFLDRGTLLGCIREGGFIASDYDIDVGIFGDEISLDEVKALFEDTPFTLIQDYEYKVGVASPTGVAIDFFLTTRERGYFLSKGYRSIHNWYFTPFDLMEYEFLGEKFLVPATYEKHLDENYGNWRDPAIFYDLSYNEPCVAYGKGPEAFSYLSKRLAHALRRGWRYYSSAAANGLSRAFGVDVRDRLPTQHSPTAAPVEPSAWTPRPIIIIDDFETYRPHQRRVIEAALSLSPDVRLTVLADDDQSPSLRVASGIDRVASTGRALVSDIDGVERLDVDALLASQPRAVVVGRAFSRLLSSVDITALLDTGCDVVFFDDDTIALDLVDGRIIGRSFKEHGA